MAFDFRGIPYDVRIKVAFDFRVIPCDARIKVRVSGCFRKSLKSGKVAAQHHSVFLCENKYTYIHMWRLQVEYEHYSIYNWLTIISSSTAILQQFSPKVGTAVIDRWELVYLIFEYFNLFCD